MSAAANVGFVGSNAELERITEQVLSSGAPVALDCESGYEGEPRGYKNASPSVHAEENLIAGFSFTTDASWARYVPVGHEDPLVNVDPELASMCLWRICATGRVVVHNAEAEERWLSRWMLGLLGGHPEVGAAVRASRGYYPLRSDTMMEAHALARWKSIALKNLSREVFGYEQVELRALFDAVLSGHDGAKKLTRSKANTLRFNVLDPTDPRVFSYACDDAIQTWRLHERHYPQVRDNFIYWLEMNVWPAVWDTEDEGLAFDWDMIDEARERAERFQAKMQAGMIAHLTERLGHAPLVKGKVFNPNSHPQLRSVLYDPPPDGLGLATRVRTNGKADGTGKQLSTNATALKGNSGDVFVRKLQDYRGMSKLLGTYLRPWRAEYGWAPDGRAHCHLLPHGAATGRFSAADFNYQNMPKKYHYVVGEEEFRLNFRDAVTVPPDHWGMGFDISQGELRIIAAESGEKAMLEAFEAGVDLHSLTASRLLHLSLDEVRAGGELFGKEWSSESGGFRPFGKTLNFALGYQLTVEGLSLRLGCTVAEAQQAWDDYFAAYPAIAAWTRKTVADSHVHGCTWSRFGRRHPIWAYESDKSWIANGGERTAGNAPIQGGLADMMKLIMIRCRNALIKAGLRETVRMCMNVHDALEFYVHKSVSPQLVVDVLYPAITEKTPWTQHWPVMRPDWHLWQRWGSPTELKLDDNRQIIGLGDVIDIGVEEDEEDDEAEPAAPPARAQSLAAAAGKLADAPARAAGVLPGDVGAGGVGTGRHHGHVIVHVTEMPDGAAVRRFLALLAEFPGPNTMELATPQGTVRVSEGTSLSPEEGAARVALVLDGARVHWAASSVDNDALAAGLAL